MESGFTPVFFLDDREHVKKGVKTIEHNFPTCVYSDELDACLDFTPTVLLSSPSCAQVSRLGVKREDRQGLFDAPLDNFDFVKAFKEIFKRDADFVVIEYLKTILDYVIIGHNKITQRTTGEVLEFPDKYKAQILNLNALDFGVPQNRSRLFIILFKPKYDFVYIVQNLNIETITVGTILKRLDDIRAIRTLPNDNFPNHTKERIERFNLLKYGESYYGSANNTRLDPDKICPVITSHRTRHVHSWQPRVLNVRECATFQGFPLDFKFFGSEQTQLDLVGKTVSPPVMKSIGNSIMECIKKGQENV